jgi:dihydroorotate dehydrogenase
MDGEYRRPLQIDPPLMNAAGSLGFAPDLRSGLPWNEFGAFVTNPVSLRPRNPAASARWGEFPGGVLVHSGHPNPGFRQVLNQYAARWVQVPLPVIVHLLASSPQEIQECVLQLEVVENIMAVEIGFPQSIGQQEAAEIISAALGELPLIARLPLSCSLEMAPVLEAAGAAAISLGAPRGSLPSGEGFTHGRMYGPAVYPLALQLVRELHLLGLNVIGAGGIYQHHQAEEMRRAGALAVQVDLALWRGDWLEPQAGEAS